MSSVAFTASSVRAWKRENNKTMTKHEIAIKTALADSLDRTRSRAAEHIIKSTATNSKGRIYNPYYARKKQPNEPGRLINRTGKLKLMLSNRATGRSPQARGWKNIKNRRKLATQKSTAFNSQVRIIRGSKYSNRYEATIRVKLHGGDSRLFDTTRGQPQESLRTLAVRFKWETGIRGQKRPIFKPVVKITEFDTTKLVAEKDALIWGR